MKKIDDKKIIDTIKKDTNYQIKTTSADILRQYRSEIVEPVKEKRKHTKLFVFGGLGATLVATAAVMLVVFASNQPGQEGENPFLPNVTIKNSTFQEQLIAFSAFTHETDSKQFNSLYDLKMRNASKPNEEDEENEKVVTKENFEDICFTFDSVNHSILELHKETEFKGFEFNEEVKGKKYKYVNEIYFKGEEKPFAKMYFNDEALITEDDDEIEYSALYYSEGGYYDLDISKETENSGNEQEVEYELEFKSLDKEHSYKIKKENEFEGVESESCYSYTTYNDRNFKEINYSLTYKSEIEKDKEKIEVQMTKDNKEYLFEDIYETDKDIKLIASLEVPVGTKVVEEIEILGTKSADKTTYTYEDLTYVI